MSNAQLTTDRILVDTDVFSYLFRRDPRADFFRPYLQHKTLAVSFMTVAELYYGALHRNWGQNNIRRLQNALKNYVVIPYDADITQIWASVKVDCESKGRTISHADAWHAACAIRHSCAFATNNGKDFQCVSSLILISPGFTTA